MRYRANDHCNIPCGSKEAPGECGQIGKLREKIPLDAALSSI
jgi:hypothetical protein